MSTTWLDLGRPLSIHDRHNPSSSTGAIDNPGSSSAGPSISDTTLSPASRIPQRYEGNYPVRASSAGIAAPLGDGYRTAASTWGASAQPGEPYMSDMGSLTRPGSYHEVDNPQSYPDDLDERNGRTLAVHPSTSPTNSSSTVHNESEKSQPQKQKFRDIGEPTDAHLEKAGVIAGATGAAHAGKKFLAQGGKEEPRGWEEVQMDEKYHIHHPQLREPRRAAIRVSDPLANRVLSGLIDRIVLSQKGAFIYGFITLWLWVCLSIFWGSTYKLETYFSRLTVHYVTFDTDPNSFLNAPMLNEVQYEAALPRSIPHLGWEVHDASEYPNGLEDVKQEVYSQKCWGAVVINANATSAWRAALANGDATYDPTGSIGLYFASARFYQVTLLYIEAFLVQALSNPLATARGQALQSFVSSSAGNVNAIALAQKVPQALGVGFGYTIFDLRSIQNSAWSSAAPMEASLIYFVIFAFYLVFYGGIARMKSGLLVKLTFKSMLALRFGWPIIAYFFMSLWQTLVVRAFQVPLENFLPHAGFVTLWALNYVTVLAEGFALETALAILGVSWLPFFLIMWIIINITSSFYPIELMPSFYKSLYWVPFNHNVEAYKIIAFGTDLVSRIGYHFGIIFTLIGVELICLPLAILFERWTGDRGKMREKAAKEREENEKREKPERGEIREV